MGNGLKETGKLVVEKYLILSIKIRENTTACSESAATMKIIISTFREKVSKRSERSGLGASSCQLWVIFPRFGLQFVTTALSWMVGCSWLSSLRTWAWQWLSWRLSTSGPNGKVQLDVLIPPKVRTNSPEGAVFTRFIGHIVYSGSFSDFHTFLIDETWCDCCSCWLLRTFDVCFFRPHILAGPHPGGRAPPVPSPDYEVSVASRFSFFFM